MKYRPWVVILLIAVGLGGCAQSPQQEMNRYVLPAQPEVDALKDTNSQISSVVIQPIDMPDYLQGPAMVLVSHDGRVYQAQQHLWAQRVDQQLRQQTLSRLQARLPQVHWLYTAMKSLTPRLMIRCEQFSADRQGHTQVRGDWQLVSAQGKVMASGYYEQSGQLPRPGYQAMSEQLGLLWSKVVDDIAVKISRSPRS